MDFSLEGDNSDAYGAGQSYAYGTDKQTGPLNEILCDSDTREYISNDESCDETR